MKGMLGWPSWEKKKIKKIIMGLTLPQEHPWTIFPFSPFLRLPFFFASWRPLTSSPPDMMIGGLLGGGVFTPPNGLDFVTLEFEDWRARPAGPFPLLWPVVENIRFMGLIIDRYERAGRRAGGRLACRCRILKSYTTVGVETTLTTP